MSRLQTTLRALLAGAILVAAALVASACAGTESAGSGGDPDKKPRVGLVIINQEAVFFKEVIRGAKQAAADDGVDLAITNGNNDASAQATAVENYSQQGLDAVIVNPVEADALKPSFATAKQAGLGVVTVDASLTDPNVDSQVGTNNLAAGRKLGQFVVKYAKGKDLKLNLGEVAALNSSVQIDRQKGFDPVVKQAGNSIVQVVDGKNVQETALQASEDLITSQGKKMNAVYATGEPALLGAVAAAKSQGATKRLNVFGWDLTADAIRGIDDGFVKGVVQQDPYAEGMRAVEAAAKLAKDEKPEAKIDVPVTIVTKTNVDRYRKLFR